MKITQEIHYSLKILSKLHPTETLRGVDIAQTTGIPLRYTLRLLTKMAGRGIISSIKGPAGGFTLNTPLEDLTLYDLNQALRGDFLLLPCIANKNCSLKSDSTACSIGRELSQLQDQMVTLLKGWNLSKIVGNNNSLES